MSRKGRLPFYNLDGEEIQKKMKTVRLGCGSSRKSWFEHFMMKEIHEQPKAVKGYSEFCLKDGKIDLTEVGLAEEDIRRFKPDLHCSMWFCLSCRNGCTVCDRRSGKIPVRVELASEFRYRNPILDPHALAIIISQSGETADSLAALRLCKEQGIRHLQL